MIQHDKKKYLCLFDDSDNTIKHAVKAKDGWFDLVLPLLQFNQRLNELSLQVNQLNTKR